ncbi:hypothetical protein FAZ15_15435 [Sphingobacterium olei]|uniref:Uncharacterized protein n=1 Tax=Sphingobacterium olei TaxID=2571155 RepID=A0A4U0NLE3_9SPHI|nr:hypothetical protein FAZ15_15435 [Sphingobacterium olei]
MYITTLLRFIASMIPTVSCR